MIQQKWIHLLFWHLVLYDSTKDGYLFEGKAHNTESFRATAKTPEEVLVELLCHFFDYSYNSQVFTESF